VLLVLPLCYIALPGVWVWVRVGFVITSRCFVLAFSLARAVVKIKKIKKRNSTVLNKNTRRDKVVCTV
jgi:D-alanyl-lipoteichoic acid acyltransferase DltB (MBOAT superfamily)